MRGIEGFVSLLKQFFPPDLDPHYLWALRVAVRETLEMAAGAMLCAGTAGLLLAIYIGARLPGWRILYALLASFRAIPDITLAILFVVIVGIGPPSGMLALAAFYAAAMGKVFADLFVSADPYPIDALLATGAKPLTVACFGLLPLRSKDLLTYASYEFESKVRACMIVGAVGAGGLAGELMGTINQLDYRRTSTLILLLLTLILLIDWMARLARKHPALLLALLPLGVASAWSNRPQMFGLSHTVAVVRSMLPPMLPPEDIHALPRLIGETLLIALGGTGLAVLLAVPMGTLAARNLAPGLIWFPTRRLLELMRAIPDVIWGLLLVTTTVIGPVAGMLAIALHSTGVFGKLYAESIENVQPDPIRALQATGGARLAVAGFGLLPLAFPPMAVHTLFRFEWNMRAASVVGIIGAGGIGQALFNSQQLFFYNRMVAYLIVTWALVMLMDLANSQLRKRWRVTEGRI